ncbi:Inorganic triphosphatase [Sodalis praecaptivus]|uniref:CYTH domain-containing protein n=1 Tax=Sodalis praecaptivus TaxID=1239307 RepID=UPI0027E884C7|nr:inorganic triphosphatase [Sodalis praecaptivus]CAJ0997709.1 Inorganic triphosphatase [Sodalis praecaptivus]
MNEEIELKFIVQPETLPALRQRLSATGHDGHALRQLTNTYFETDGFDLRRHGIGLRIRQVDGQYEMTMKTAGQVIGGLHQHPEYNVPLPGPMLELQRLPAQAWPEGLSPAALQSRLKPLFTTDFAREKWRVTQGESQIEVALDRGEVSAGPLSEPICELEMELLSGNARDLFTFAKTLSNAGGLRLGSLSKAARGYHLQRGNPARAIRPLPLLNPAARATVEEGMSAALHLALDHWQYHEELWLRGDSQAKVGVLEGITLIRETFRVMGNLVRRKATTALRTLLADIMPLIAAERADPQAICYLPVYLQTKLALTSWLMFSVWQNTADADTRRKLAGAYRQFADMTLARCGTEFKVAFGRTLSDEEYLQQLPRLERRLMAFHVLSGAYRPTEVVAYLMHWKALHQSIVQQGPEDREHLRRQALAQVGFWLK